jgi:hypothetical protein
MCLYAKQTLCSSPGKTSPVVADRNGVLKNNHLLPGQCISMDHFICSNKGRLFKSRDKTALPEMYCGGCIFIDHASGYIHVKYQAHLNTHETLKAKESFKLMCRDHGIVPQSYQTDNGSSFTSSGFFLTGFVPSLKSSILLEQARNITTTLQSV